MLLSLSTPVRMMVDQDLNRALELAIENIEYLEDLQMENISEKASLESELKMLQIKYEALYDRMYAPERYIRRDEINE